MFSAVQETTDQETSGHRKVCGERTLSMTEKYAYEVWYLFPDRIAEKRLDSTASIRLHKTPYYVMLRCYTAICHYIAGKWEG